MDLKERRERLNQLISDLAKATSPEVMWMREMFELQYEDAKERLVEAETIDIPRIQGEARYIEKLFRQMSAASALLRSHQDSPRSVR